MQIENCLRDFDSNALTNHLMRLYIYIYIFTILPCVRKLTYIVTCNAVTVISYFFITV